MKTAVVTRSRRAFTLIEIMIVVGIMGLVMAMGLPAIYHSVHKGTYAQAINDVLEACRQTREQAIMSGKEADLTFRPHDRTFSGGKFSGRLPDSVGLEMLDVNFTECKAADSAQVRFYPNGMCDEMTVILRSDHGEYRKITLEITTSLTSVGGLR
ncbi:MAG TPA: type II secretion system protein [Dongiaceae bacterium]|nr:type II secretion system protein [Dongiaceae bacterium]